jgi:hypothetical protein
MFVFLVSEVPRVFLSLLFSVKYISQPITRSCKRFIFHSVNLLMMGFEQSMKILLRDYTGIFTEKKDWKRSNTIRIMCQVGVTCLSVDSALVC